MSPFARCGKEPGGRTMVPGDMDEESSAAVRQLGFAVTDGELRARLLDVTWDRLRDAEAAREAVRSYLEAANALFDPEHWSAYAFRIERAARLARANWATGTWSMRCWQKPRSVLSKWTAPIPCI